MKNTVIDFLDQLKRNRSRRRKTAAVLVCLSLIVAGSTTWALHINGESQTGEIYCGLEEHQHSEACVEKVLICGYDTEGTTAAETNLRTADPEPETKSGHTHSDSCYEEQTVLTCAETEHTHSAENGCYDGDGNLACEIPEHTHSEENGCYTTEQVLVCGLEEGAPETTVSATETSREIPTHVHTDECYEITYICGFNYEHTHTLSCFSNPDADVETAADWEKMFASVELTGVYADDVLAIAKTQLGYTESADNYQVVLDAEGNETTETKGHTRYGAWYGQPYEDWDAMFVSFCLNYADITDEMVPYEASCPDWVKSLSDLGFYEPVYVEALDEDGNTVTVRSDYTPEMGDLIFFDTDGDEKADHVGIVEELETKEKSNDDGTVFYTYIVHTIEGNSADAVAEQKYDLEEETILGYGSIYSAYLSAVDDGLIENVRRLTAETEDGVTFSAIGEIPENAVLEVSPLTEEQNTYLQENGLTGIFYDIKILVDGEKYQPTDPIQISISGLGYDASTVLEGFHLTVDAGDLMTSEDFDTLSVDVQNTGNRVTLEADSFSIYGVSELEAETYELTNVAAVNSLSLRLRTMSYSEEKGTCIEGYISPSDTLPLNGKYTCYEYTENTTHYYLIPVDYLSVKYEEYGFVFSETQTQVCPFVYGVYGETDYWQNAPAGSYVEYNGEYYVQVKCTSGKVPMICYTVLTVATDTVTPSNTVINMFDYWTTTERSDSDNHNFNSTDKITGINKDHVLKFGRRMGSNNGLLNYSYGSTSTPSKVTVGIVQNTLGTDGYPRLSGNTAIGMTESDTYSLSYLFDPNEKAEGKQSFTGATGLLSVDEQGYFYYNSAERYAQLDEETKAFTVYEQPAGYNTSAGIPYGQFYPFNDAHQVALLGCEKDPINHYFGMTLTTRFIQKNNGYTTATHTTPTTFEFSGDNDVWIFIDDVLVADLGGLGAARSVTIDFSTGTVDIDDSTTDDSNPSTTLYKAFDAAGKASGVSWRTYTKDGTEYTTFANNTTHTLKFYYLERGNLNSNLMLKYNLTDVPATSIYKVDQYGDSVGGATFAVYQAERVVDTDGNETYYYLLDDGNKVTSFEDYYVDPETGAVYTDKNKTTAVIENPAYWGTTDETGQMIFTDGDGLPYSISELSSMFGEYFFLREIQVPEGFRTVSDDVVMWIDPEVEMLQTAESPYLTGVWSSPNALVTASNTLYIANKSDYNKISDDSVDSTAGTINYYSLSEDGKRWDTNGTLFAVVLDRGEAGVSDFASWMPLQGNDENGYETLESGIANAIKAAQSYGNSHVFSYASSGMQALIEELPGELSQYYTYQETRDGFNPENDDEGKLKYLVAYYWTSGTLADANESNTVRVASHRSTTADGDDGFSVQWGATIEVPNVINALYFQKADESVTTLIDNAVFALYEVKTATNSSGDELGYYVATAENGDEAYVRLDEDASGDTATGKATVYDSNFANPVTGSYTIQTDNITIPKTNGTGYITDEDAGVITVVANTTYTITPAKNAQGNSLVGYTHDKCDTVSEEGTGHFKYIKTGNYFLKEIFAPAGYILNSENIMVAVNQKGVYASAGDEDNNVRVGNGPGYLVKTLDTFASVGHIDETLSWIYGVLKVDDEHDNCFEGVNNLENETSFGVNDISYPLLSTNVTIGGENSLTNNRDPYNNTTAMVTYQQYDGEANVGGTTNDSIFDYVVVSNDTHNSGTVNGVAGTGTLRLWTESGWSDMAIYQDTTYGLSQPRTTTEYTDLSSYGDLAYLFSSSTFVQVSDTVNIDLTVTKVTDDFYASSDAENTTTVYLDDAEFTLTRYVVKDTENIVTRETAVDTDGTVKEGFTLQYYDPDTDEWDTPEKKLTSKTTFTDGTGMEYTVTSKVYAYQDDETHHLVYTKVFTINDQTYKLESIEDGKATLKPVTVNTDSTTGKTTTTDTDGKTLTGTLARSYFKIRGLSQGTYYLTETKNPSYTTAKGTSEYFQNLSETVITFSDGKYYYYVKDDNKIIVTDADDVKTDPDTQEKYIELTNVAEDGTTTTTKYTVYEGNSFSVSIDGDDASYLVELDDQGTTAAYYEDVTGTVQMGFRVNNAIYQSVGADIQLVKVDATDDQTIDGAYPGDLVGYSSDFKYFLVGNSNDATGDHAAHRVLTGAEFKLHRISEEEGENGETIQTKLYYKLNTDGTAETTSSEADATVLKVNEKGYLQITGLNTGYTYYLVETKVPDGYAPLTQAVKISWSNGTLTVDSASATIQNVDANMATGLEEYEHGDYIVIYNWTGYELPETGGTGATMFTVGGLLLITVTLVYGCGLRRKRERRAK